MARRRRAGNEPAERGRFSARRKTEAVLRLLRGEDVDTVSRELGVTAATLAGWRDHFLAGGQSALKIRPADDRDEEVLRLRAKVGEIMMANELLVERARRAEGDLGPFVVAEVEELGHTISASAGRPYGVERVCLYLDIPRSSLYWRRARDSAPPRPPQRPGPKTYRDQELTDAIRHVIAVSPFVGEGYRKAWARLRLAGVRTAKRRVNRLMREAGLLSPSRVPRVRPGMEHEGTITTDAPDVMWGTDGTSCVTGEGVATIFIAVDHCTTECIGVHVARPGTRFEALEPLRQGILEHFGPYQQNVAAGLSVRHDHGSQFMSDYYQAELRFLGIESSPAFVRQPEGNGCAEHFVRVLKEQVLWTQWFETIEGLRLALLAFKERYNREWLVERHQHRTPTQVRAMLTAELAA